MLPNRLLDPDYRSQRRVPWVDVDALGQVYFANYLRYLEETEYAFLKSRGLNVVLADPAGTLGFPRIRSSLDIIRPALFDELLTVWLKLKSNDGVQLHYAFEITGDDQRLVAQAEFVVACCRFRPGELPRAILIPDKVLQEIPETGSERRGF